MNERMRPILLWGLVLAVLWGVFWFTQRTKQARRAGDAPTGDPVLQLQKDDITQVAVKDPRRPLFTLRRRGKGWRLYPGGHKVDQTQAESLLEAAEALRFSTAFPLGGGRKAARFGLARPREWYVFTGADGRKVRLFIGAQSPAPGNQYARLDEQPRALVVSEGDLFNLRQTDQQLRDKTILDLDQDDLTALRWQAPDGVVNELRRQPPTSPVRFLTGDSLPLKSLEMETLLGELAQLKAMSFAPPGTPRPLGAGSLRLSRRGAKPVTLYLWHHQPGQFRLQKKGNPQIYYQTDQPWFAHLQNPPVAGVALPVESYDVAAVRFVGGKISLRAARGPGGDKFVCSGEPAEANCPQLFDELLENLTQATANDLKRQPRPPAGAPLYRFSFFVKQPGDDKKTSELLLNLYGPGPRLLAHSPTLGLGFTLDDSQTARLEVWQNRLIRKKN